MKRTGPIATLVMGMFTFGVLALFLFSFTLFEPIGRAGLPAVVLEIGLAVCGTACMISGAYRLRRKSNHK